MTGYCSGLTEASDVGRIVWYSRGSFPVRSAPGLAPGLAPDQRGGIVR